RCIALINRGGILRHDRYTYIHLTTAVHTKYTASIRITRMRNLLTWILLGSFCFTALADSSGDKIVEQSLMKSDGNAGLSNPGARRRMRTDGEKPGKPRGERRGRRKHRNRRRRGKKCAKGTPGFEDCKRNRRLQRKAAARSTSRRI
ncbi:hypothetical protein T265_13459, partial [Opisthorchis viverrini]